MLKDTNILLDSREDSTNSSLPALHSIIRQSSSPLRSHHKMCLFNLSEHSVTLPVTLRLYPKAPVFVDISTKEKKANDHVDETMLRLMGLRIWNYNPADVKSRNFGVKMISLFDENQHPLTLFTDTCTNLGSTETFLRKGLGTWAIDFSQTLLFSPPPTPSKKVNLTCLQPADQLPFGLIYRIEVSFLDPPAIADMQLIGPDGEAIPLGSGGFGRVFSLNDASSLAASTAMSEKKWLVTHLKRLAIKSAKQSTDIETEVICFLVLFDTFVTASGLRIWLLDPAFQRELRVTVLVDDIFFLKQVHLPQMDELAGLTTTVDKHVLSNTSIVPGASLLMALGI
ncbi:unnamed protein product, partial [Protopolystoma xenopodis]